MDFERFIYPDKKFSPAPFWAINDRLTPEETARQMRDLMHQGFSGGFFHSRIGLTTEYMGEEWFSAMKSALEAARVEDGYLWLYDEDLWPSGNAGGLIAGTAEEYRAIVLEAEFVPSGMNPMPDEDDEVKAIYLLAGRIGCDIEGAVKIGIKDEHRHIDADRLVFRHHFMEKTGWWSGESYANLLNPDAVREFINQTHEVYKEQFGADFGGRIPGIFTDEPLLTRMASSIVWWDGLPKVYEEWHGRNFWSDLPYIFFDGHQARKIRLLIHRTILQQFVNSFTKQIFDWCDANGLLLTGHMSAEDSIDHQIIYQYGGVMAHYRYMHIPGIDHIYRQIEGRVPDGLYEPLLTVKQVSSAARQLGKKRVLTELFGVSRHTCTFEDFKWLGDFNLVLGANFFCPHLSLYSAKGRRKKDYPPNWNYQQTYWNDIHSLNDYFTRIAEVLMSGTASPDVLILLPTEGATASHRFGWRSEFIKAYKSESMAPDRYSRMDPDRLLPADLPKDDFSEVHFCDRMLRRTLEAALNAGYDCDLGDEGYIDDLGSVSRKAFKLGEMSYPIVVVPPSQTWRPRTLKLLMEFAENGGKVILLGKLPVECDCEDASDDWKALATKPCVQSLPCAKLQLQEALDRVSAKGFSLRAPDGSAVSSSYVHHRIDGEQEIYFIVNSDRNRTQDYVLTIENGAGLSVASWNPVDGSRLAMKPQTKGDDARFAFTLHPVGSILIVSEQHKNESQICVNEPIDLSKGELIRLPDDWKFCRSEENVLVMDRISVSLDGGVTWWNEDIEWRVRKCLAEYFGTSDALQWQPWVAIKKNVFDGKCGEIILRYKFLNTVDHLENVKLVLEDIHKGKVSVNGHNVDISDARWQWDRSFGKVKISDYVQIGENIVDFRVKFDFLTEVEPAYIVGDFGVHLVDPYEGEIIDELPIIKNGSWLNMGYPFYSGNISYQTNIDMPMDEKRIFLRLLRPSGILFKIRVNGEDAGKLLWRPWEIELTSFLKPGRNELEIEIVSSRQNTLGPLHEQEGEDNMLCGPLAFSNDDLVRDEFSLFDYGLLGGAELVSV